MWVLCSCDASPQFVETNSKRVSTVQTGFNVFINWLRTFTVQSKYVHMSDAFEGDIFQTKLKLKHENKQPDAAELQSPLTGLTKDFSSIKGEANLHN